MDLRVPQSTEVAKAPESVVLLVNLIGVGEPGFLHELRDHGVRGRILVRTIGACTVVESGVTSFCKVYMQNPDHRLSDVLTTG